MKHPKRERFGRSENGRFVSQMGEHSIRTARAFQNHRGQLFVIRTLCYSALDRMAGLFGKQKIGNSGHGQRSPRTRFPFWDSHVGDCAQYKVQ